MKKVLLLILGIFVFLKAPVFSEQWRLHPTYAGYVKKIIDTPHYTYLLSRNQLYRTSNSSYAFETNSLFRYDKEGSETQWLSIQNLLTSPIITTAEYNYNKGYLMVVYEDGNIDLIYDDGRVVNVPGLKVAEDYTKNVNSITFVPGSDYCYLATDFGYIVINDKKGEIASSRILNRAVNGMVEYNGKYYIGTDEGLLVSDTRPGSELAEVGEPEKVVRFFIVGPRLYMHTEDGSRSYVSHIVEENGEIKINPFFISLFDDVSPTKDGLMAVSSGEIWMLDSASAATHYVLPESLYGKKTGGYDGRNFWFDFRFDGVKEMQAKADDKGWTLTGRSISPNASNSFKSPSMTYSENYGMLVRNQGYDYNFTTVEPPIPDFISGLKNMEWSPYSIAARTPELGVFSLGNPNGLSIDPQDKDMAYCGSVMSGILRLNLADPSKSLRLSRFDDPYAGKTGFIGIVPPNGSIKQYTSFGKPAFDVYGNMWVLYYNIDSSFMELWYWTPEDRKATTSSATYRPMKKYDLKNIKGSNGSILLPLSSQANKNMIVVVSYNSNAVRILDHNGTIENQGDDSKHDFSSNVYDQDGNLIDAGNIRTLYEDPATGNVWAGCDRAVYYFNPKDLISGSGDTRVTRIKVPRNDGTNYADYLLDGSSVNAITSDGRGRKWFATDGGGLVCTSSTGTEIIKVYTEDNSLLPSNRVYGVAYNPANKSMMVSTDSGLAELYLSATGETGEENEDVKVYPNPVRPDYYGYVKIEGLEDDSLVKITDSAGNLVKELGRVLQGDAEWDVTNLNNKRVRSGVYYVLASGASDGSGYAAVAKILVVN